MSFDLSPAVEFGAKECLYKWILWTFLKVRTIEFRRSIMTFVNSLIDIDCFLKRVSSIVDPILSSEEKREGESPRENPNNS
jgi:hypothetical protein